MNRRTSFVAVLAVVMLAGWASPVDAQHKAHPEHADHEVEHEHELGVPDDESFGEYARRVWNRDKLTGDWMGFRNDAKDHGLTVDFTMSQFYQSLASGGVHKDDTYGAKLDLRVTADANKLMGLWPGLYATVHMETQWGDGLTGDTGAFTLPNAAMLYPAPDSRRTEFTGYLIEQYLSKNLALFAGKLHTFDLWTAFYPKDVGYGLDGFMNVNSLATGWPWLRFVNLAMWGGGGWTITDDGQIQAGLIVFDVSSAATTNDITDAFGDGVAGLAFYKFFYDLFEMPGSVLLAVGGSTAKYGSLDPHDFGVVPGQGLTNDEKRGSVAGGSYLRQVFWQAEGDKDRNVWLYMGASVNSGNPNFAKWNVFATLNSVGSCACRPKDRMGVSFWYTGLTNNFQKLTRGLGVPTRDSYGGEIFYNIQINPWLHLSPDLQIVRNDRKGDNTEIIPGARLVIDF